MDDDLDVSGALAVVFDAVRNGNASLDAGQQVADLAAAFDQMVDVLGLDLDSSSAQDIDISGLVVELDVDAASIDELLARRDVARSEKDFALSDAIRDGLSSLGVTIEDTPDGARWHRD
jgi:cysteinyl-tRNA synthetase